MIRYILRKNTNSKSRAYNKWFAFPVIEQTVDLEALAEHMADHNTPFSKGAIKGILTDMVACIKELLLEGKNVKIADLAIFSIGIKNSAGSEDPDEFTVQQNVKGVKLRARGTGGLITKSLNLVASLKKAVAVQKKSDSNTENPQG
jgi:predicted histone-like DNA-binding protein